MIHTAEKKRAEANLSMLQDQPNTHSNHRNKKKTFCSSNGYESAFLLGFQVRKLNGYFGCLPRRT